MKKLLLIGIGLLMTASTSAFYGAGYTIDGEVTDSVRTSVEANTTIVEHGTARGRSLKTWARKNVTNQARLGISRRKSIVLPREAARYRGSNSEKEDQAKKEKIAKLEAEKVEKLKAIKEKLEKLSIERSERNVEIKKDISEITEESDINVPVKKLNIFSIWKRLSAKRKNK